MAEVAQLYLGRARALLGALGVWLPPRRRRAAAAYRLYAALVFLSQYSFLLLELVYIARAWGDMDAVSEASYLLFTQACLCYKMTAFFCKRPALRRLVRSMRADVFRPRNRLQEMLVAEEAARIKRVCLFFLVMACVTCLLWALIPLFDATADARVFPFKIWMPAGSSESPQYELGYAYQVIGIYVSAFIFNGVDSVALSMIMFATAQLRLVRDKALAIKYTEMKKSKAFLALKQDRFDNNYNELSDCILHHQTIKRFVAQVEAAYHTNILFQLCGSVGIICITGLRISIVEPRSMQFMSMVSYLLAMLLQLYTYCWCGQELTIASIELRSALYLCPWYTQGAAFNRSLWIAFECMKRPLVFRCGRYVALSLQTFLSIQRSSYSYFAVLQQVRDK